MNRIAIVAPLLALGACSSLSAMPTVPASDTARIEARIVSACAYSGLFTKIGDLAVSAVPVVALPQYVIKWGIDDVCRNPAKYAQKAGIAEWVLRSLISSSSKAAL